MRKIFFIFSILFLGLGGGIYYFVNQELIVTQTTKPDLPDLIYCKLRYKLPLNIKLIVPTKVVKAKDNKYQKQFADVGSDIKFFDTLKVDKNYLLLDVKSKYVKKINYQQIDNEILVYCFGVENVIASQITLILKTETTIAKRKDALEHYCLEIKQFNLFEKGLQKLIKF